MTILLFRDDPYMREFDATVVRVEGNFVVLDRTCFFPRGGGQVGDTGELSGSRVVDTLREGDEVRHILEDDIPHSTSGSGSTGRSTGTGDTESCASTQRPTSSTTR